MLHPLFFKKSEHVLSLLEKIKSENISLEKLSSQLIVDINGDTYFIPDLINLSEDEVSQLNSLRFKNKNKSEFTLAELLYKSKENTLNEMIFNKELADILVILADANSKNIRNQICNINPPSCAISRSEIFLAAIDLRGNSYEAFSIFKWLQKKKTCPIDNSALEENDLVINK